MATSSPVKFVKPAELFKMRQARKHEYKFDITSQSPLKCLMDPSPIKNIPTLLKNPFKGKGVKRRLSLDTSSTNSSSRKRPSSNSSSPQKPKKMTKFSLQMDEDANMEMPHLNSNGASYCDSDFDDEDDLKDLDASSILEGLGITVSQQDFSSLGKFK